MCGGGVSQFFRPPSPRRKVSGIAVPLLVGQPLFYLPESVKRVRFIIVGPCSKTLIENRPTELPPAARRSTAFAPVGVWWFGLHECTDNFFVIHLPPLHPRALPRPFRRRKQGSRGRLWREFP